MANQYIATFDQKVSSQCTYCKEEEASSTHIRWQCKFFEPTREDTDKDLAHIPRQYLLECVKCGIAPAMKIEGDLTYWGMQVSNEESNKTKELLGVSMQLTTPGENVWKRHSSKNYSLQSCLQCPRIICKTCRQCLRACSMYGV